MHPTNFRPEPGPTRRRAGHQRRPGILALFTALVCLAGLAIAVLHDSLPGTSIPEVTATPAQERVGAVSWPADGTSAADISGTGLVEGPGATRPVPIASVAKLMTAYVILRDHPLAADESGPDITIEPSEASGYSSQVSDGDSVVAVAPGEEISERHALEALLLPSADNLAWILARWDAGSQDAFVAKMNAAARSLGMTSTSYTDASGLDASTVSTAGDQVRLGAAAMRVPALAAITDMPDAVVPVAGT
ncbi:MAG: hypothetical protein FWE35_29415, partial [Streptosporangiales bacterium]|nr:hypothetical protein [Streptosporangiales bacterium]